MKPRKLIFCLIATTVIAISVFVILKDDVTEVTHSELLQIENYSNTFPTYLWYMGRKDGYDFFHASHNKTTGLGYSGIYKVKGDSTKILSNFDYTLDSTEWISYPAKIYMPNPVEPANPFK